MNLTLRMNLTQKLSFFYCFLDWYGSEFQRGQKDLVFESLERLESKSLFVHPVRAPNIIVNRLAIDIWSRRIPLKVSVFINNLVVETQLP